MANVKITDLTAIAGADLASNDVLPIVDINVDQTKKVAISDLTIGISDANDFVTYTQLNSNINVVQDNVAANFVQLNANLDIVQDNVAAVSVNLTIAADSGTNDTVVVGTDTLTFAGDTGITTTVSDNQISIDLDDTAVTAGIYGGKIGTVSNVPVLTIDAQGRITSASNSEVAVDLSTLEGNVNTVSSNVAAVESRRAANNTALTNEDTALQSRLTTNVTAFTNEDTALQARITANTLVAASNDFVTYTQLNSNINVVQDNVASIIDGTTAFTGDVTIGDTTDDSAAGPEFILYRNSATPADGDYLGQIQFKGKQDAGGDEVYAKVTGKISDASAGTEDGLIETAIKGAGSFTIVSRQKSDELQLLNSVGLSVDGSSTFTNQVTMNDDLIVTGNLTVNGDTVTINTTNKEIDDTLIMLANGTTGTPSNDIGILFNRGNQGNAAFFYDESSVTFKISDTLDPSSNTSLSPVTAANLDVGILTAATLKYDGTDVGTSITDNVAAVETRRTANIAGAISTVLTSDLTASRAVIAGTGGKIEVSDITSTELGYLDGMTQNINSNLVALAAGIAGVSGGGAFPTGDYGLLDAANSSTDSFGVAIAGLTTFDMKTDPSGSLSTEDLGALT